MQTTASATDSSQKTLHHQIVIIGGGAGGITVAAQLLRQNSKLDIAIIEPSDKHYYQPAWTLVGGGKYNLLDTVKDEQECIPSQAKWIKDYVEKLDPDNNLVITRQGSQIFYEYLVVAAGIQLDWHLIKGLPDALGKGGVCSNYAFEIAPYTWEVINHFKGGNAIFTFPATPIKCAGAPQKIMYLADDAFRKNGVRQKTNILYCAAAAKIFAIDAYAVSLMKVVERKGITLNFKHNLKEIKAESKEAVFDVTTDDGVQELTLSYDMIHVAPPMSAPDFIKNSKLATPAAPSLGWVDVHKYTLQHNVYSNVFSLGDVSSLPTSKTAAAVRGEAPVLVENLLSLMNKQALNASYNGYTCCPLVTGYGKTIMAEFDYDGNPISTFPIDQTQEHYTMWLMKKYALPWVYWHRMLKGEPFEGNILRQLQGKK
ncbi:FAD-dependent pyridine nucleotide-disulphide oxidoreductase [Gloeothece citriformis PCC 7424]|uniref:FAD-dependent pyridine nucleotide-disulphide oxidoreductase n=1 Tax=Gloeothece citriformis (strain PCC 7424) TaxID=65393 RepID=B7KJ55_GLOC7|nr:FAD/NAD(P)-binding oxidoreductase [Gloeothece citriformis]ACK72139.1 FAD-dependent pyridine nucleotide-disulphide oxidoreductase [Gloeothece citriformis PCC 7424]